MIAAVFPEELTALRAGGLVFAVLLIAFGVWRRRSLSNGAVLLAILGGIGLAIVSGTELLDTVLSAFSFERGNGGRFDVVRSVEIRLAGAKATNIDSLGFHRLRFAVDREGKGRS